MEVVRHERPARALSHAHKFAKSVVPVVLAAQVVVQWGKKWLVPSGKIFFWIRAILCGAFRCFPGGVLAVLAVLMVYTQTLSLDFHNNPAKYERYPD